MKLLRLVKHPAASLVCNIAYAAGNCLLGYRSHSWWFLTVGAYYGVLAAARFSVLQIRRKAGGNAAAEQIARRITGWLLMALSVCLVGVNILSGLKDRGTVFHEILMITIASYTFAKITLAILGMIKAKHAPSPGEKTLRNISFADAVVSVYTLQRSMLVSFPGMTHGEIQLFNILTGTAAWLVVLLLGLNLIGGKRITMAKNKIAEANEKIAAAVVGGYKKIETGVVDCYTKIEDKFVGTFLTRDGETVEDAKARLKKEP